jgi:hypothetical protein
MYILNNKLEFYDEDFYMEQFQIDEEIEEQIEQLEQIEQVKIKENHNESKRVQGDKRESNKVI